MRFSGSQTAPNLTLAILFRPRCGFLPLALWPIGGTTCEYAVSQRR
jgi:hypothetical protein